MIGRAAMAERKVVILGGKGMLGTDVTSACIDAGREVKSLDLPEFDITRDDDLSEAVGAADLLVNCAAYTNVDKAESEYELAYRINATAVGKLGELARRADKWLLHISTDFVFDGESPRPYRETDEPNPISAYGRTKLAGEQLLARSGCGHCILRLEWSYGRAGNNFIKKIISQAQQNGRLKVVDDQIGAPTATTEIASIICTLLAKKPMGCFHYAAAGRTSRFGIARFILDKLGINAELSPCKTADFVTPARRPLNSLFDCGKIQELLDEPILNWKIPLERFLEQL
jgi:dTDP-4-dehydrorhamnose reductase